MSQSQISSVHNGDPQFLPHFSTFSFNELLNMYSIFRKTWGVERPTHRDKPGLLANRSRYRKDTVGHSQDACHHIRTKLFRLVDPNFTLPIFSWKNTSLANQPFTNKESVIKSPPQKKKLENLHKYSRYFYCVTSHFSRLLTTSYRPLQSGVGSVSNEHLVCLPF